VIGELASWMASGTEIDASFVTRHGPPGLVAATRRIFGRFEAALNVAGLHVSKLYPDGPPAKPGVTHDERKRVARGPTAATAAAPAAAEWSAQSEPAAGPGQDS
jgi:hypothetical protein